MYYKLCIIRMESVLLKELNLSPIGPGMYGHCSIDAEEVILVIGIISIGFITNSVIGIFTTVKLITTTICIMSMAIIIIIVIIIVMHVYSL